MSTAVKTLQKLLTFQSKLDLLAPHQAFRLALLAAWLAGNTTTPARAELRVIGPEAPFGGSTLSQWAVAWWQWYYQIPGAMNPRTDRTGKDAAHGQDGPVWFLADSFVPTLVRHIQVPAGRALLIPVVEHSWVATLPEDPRTVKGNLPFLQPFELSDLRLTIDSLTYTNLPAHFLQSELIDSVKVAAGHPSGTQPGIFGPALGQGLFVLLEAPTPGRHQIRFAARWRP